MKLFKSVLIVQQFSRKKTSVHCRRGREKRERCQEIEKKKEKGAENEKITRTAGHIIC